MAIKKTETAPETKWPTGITFFINEDQKKVLDNWKQAHNTIFGYCSDHEYEYVFCESGDEYTITVKNTYHDTEICLSSEDLN